MKRPKRLSASFVRTVSQSGRYGDGRGGFGLSLLVKPTTTGRLSKTWSQRLRIHGRSVNIGLGAYPVVTLAEARRKVLENRRAVAQGRDPRAGGIPTFTEAMEKVIAIHRPSWRSDGNEAEWRSTLRLYMAPRLGHKRVNAITTADVMGVLLADDFWNAKRVTARRVRQRIGAVMKWAVAQGFREDNPAGDAISAALPKNGSRVKHQPALPHVQVAGALRRINESEAMKSTKLALRFLVLTATRSGEVRQATWQEIDLEASIWTIPEERMKMGRAHRIPLSPEAVEVLEQAKGLGDGGLLFPGRRLKPLGQATFPKLIRSLEIACVPHGFRSSFRDWCAESGVAREVAEAALAHVVKNKVEAAYARSDLLELRRQVMEDWGRYVARSRPLCQHARDTRGERD
ncbi:MAG: tyrosine-type recombinase/integrase [Gemmatimonadota bacterium]|nr:tyrosine-type recombinase/integrase [Gemmatimonadota bacterium]